MSLETFNLLVPIQKNLANAHENNDGTLMTSLPCTFLETKNNFEFKNK